MQWLWREWQGRVRRRDEPLCQDADLRHDMSVEAPRRLIDVIVPWLAVHVDG